MAGCVVVPISGPSEAPLAGKRITVQEAKAVAAVGKSRAEVVSVLGRPTIELQDLKIAVYPWIEHKGDLLALWLLAYPIGAEIPETEDWALLVAFDEGEHVARAGLARWKPSESINTTARDWAESQGLKGPLPQTGFAASPIPQNKSLIYIFRSAPPSSWKTVLGAGVSWPRPVAVAVDGTYVSEMHDETYVALVVEPGLHELVADALPPYRYVERGSLAIEAEKRKPASIVVVVQANRANFVELRCTSGTGTVETMLSPLPEGEAIPILQKMRPVW